MGRLRYHHRRLPRGLLRTCAEGGCRGPCARNKGGGEGGAVVPLSRWDFVDSMPLLPEPFVRPVSQGAPIDRRTPEARYTPARDIVPDRRSAALSRRWGVLELGHAGVVRSVRLRLDRSGRASSSPVSSHAACRGATSSGRRHLYARARSATDRPENFTSRANPGGAGPPRYEGHPLRRTRLLYVIHIIIILIRVHHRDRLTSS